MLSALQFRLGLLRILRRARDKRVNIGELLVRQPFDSELQIPGGDTASESVD